MSGALSKNPTKVRAGQAGALKRWGPPGTRTINIGDLTPPQRRLVQALAEAVRTEGEAAGDAAA